MGHDVLWRFFNCGFEAISDGVLQRVPRSQISRAHPGQPLGYAEGTSAVLSALSGDDETALSAAEAAGVHPGQCLLLGPGVPVG